MVDGSATRYFDGLLMVNQRSRLVGSRGSVTRSRDRVSVDQVFEVFTRVGDPLV